MRGWKRESISARLCWQWRVIRFFEPYIGSDYEKGLPGGHKLLIIGESHYNEPGCEDCGEQATREIVARYLAGTSIRFFDDVASAASGHRLALARHVFWRSVAFANFVQRPMATASHRPTDDDWAASIAPFWQTVGELKPDLVFMFTSAWSNWLPSLAPGGDPERTGPVGNDPTWLWRYGLADRNVLIARFNHPSARSNPPRAVWKAWADYCWQVLEQTNG
jgi:hypothetical protein